MLIFLEMDSSFLTQCTVNKSEGFFSKYEDSKKASHDHLHFSAYKDASSICVKSIIG